MSASTDITREETKEDEEEEEKKEEEEKMRRKRRRRRRRIENEEDWKSKEMWPTLSNVRRYHFNDSFVEGD